MFYCVLLSRFSPDSSGNPFGFFCSLLLAKKSDLGSSFFDLQKQQKRVKD